MELVNGSLNTKTPTNIAVTGSNAPKTAVIVLLIFFNAMIKVMLLIAVGTKPNNAKLMPLVNEGIASKPEEVNKEYTQMFIIVKKNI